MKINYKSLTIWIMGFIILIFIYFLVEREIFSFIVLSYFATMIILISVMIIGLFKETVFE